MVLPGNLGRNSSVNFDELYRQRVFVLTTTLLGTKIPTFLEHTFRITEQIEFAVLSFVFCQNFLKPQTIIFAYVSAGSNVT